MKPPLVDARHLHFSYPDGRKVLDGLSLEVERGERVAVLGPNGAGKTTLALHLNGILTPDDGSVAIAGLDVDEPNLMEVRRRVGLVFQDPNDQLFMPTVAEDVAFGPANLGIEEPELSATVQSALELVGAGDLASRPPHHLSGGEKRRVAIATVLSMSPELLVLDEPTSGLDPAGRRELIETLQGLDLAMLVISHDLSLADELCERSVIVDGGRVVADRATREILSDQATLESHRLELPRIRAVDSRQHRDPPHA